MIRAIIKLFQRGVGYIYKRVDPVGYARSIGVEIGAGCRLLGVDFGSEPYLVKLGDRVSATQVNFVTHDGGVWVFREAHPDWDVFGDIQVGSNVFLGLNVIVLPGSRIESNVVVGAGAIVKGILKSGNVYAGVPARALCSIEDYRGRMERVSVSTKHMSCIEKRLYLTKQFHPRN